MEAEHLEDLYRTLGLSPPGDVPATADEADEADEAGAPTPPELVASARRFHRRLRRTLNEALEEVGLSYAQYEVLQAVGADPNQHAGSIAYHLGTSRQAVSVLVRKLFEASLLEPLPSERGVRGLRLTGRGAAVLARCGRALEPFHLLLEGLSPASRRTLRETLDAAEAALQPPPRWSF